MHFARIYTKERKREGEILGGRITFLRTADMKSADEPEKLGQRYVNQEFRYSEHSIWQSIRKKLRKFDHYFIETY